MRKALFRSVVALACLTFILIGTAIAQDFQKTYGLSANGAVSVRNVSGDVIVTSYDGEAVVVKGFKEGRDREMVEVEDRSSNDRVDVRVRYPERCNCDASVRFEVLVPRAAAYNFERLSTASGGIEINRVRGDVRADTASGNITVKEVTGAVTASTASGELEIKDITGTINARSASGNVDVSLAQLAGTSNMKFSSASGDVSVRMPASSAADIEMSTLSGSLKTDFPLEINKERYGPRQSARGRLGDGSRSLHISSISGNVSLMSF